MPLRLDLLAAAALITSTTFALAEPATLDVIAWKGNEAEPAGLPELLARFEAQNPDIKVDLTYVARKDIDKVVPPRLQGGNPPDVTMVDSSLVKLWGDAGLLTDLGQSSPWFGQIKPTSRKFLASGDKIYVMPLENIGMGNFVNTDLLKKAGITEVPLTVEATEAACKALSAAGISPMIFTGAFPATLWVGANAISPKATNTADYGDGKLKFEGDPAFDGALDTVRALVDAGCFDPKLQAGIDPWSTALQEFKAGHTAMLPQGAWNIKAFSQVDGLHYVFAPMPSVNAKTGVAVDLIGPGWAIPTQAKHAEAAHAFVEFFSKPENLSVLLTAEGAYAPFEGMADGVPELAALNSAARAKGDVILWPLSTLEYPKVLQNTWEESMAGFLLDLGKPNSDTLKRWDQTIEDNL